MGGELAGNSDAKRSSRHKRYSQAAREERFWTLPLRFSAGEISVVRTVEKSAEGIVCAEQRVAQEG